MTRCWVAALMLFVACGGEAADRRGDDGVDRIDRRWEPTPTPGPTAPPKVEYPPNPAAAPGSAMTLYEVRTPAPKDAPTIAISSCFAGDARIEGRCEQGTVPVDDGAPLGESAWRCESPLGVAGQLTALVRCGRIERK